MASATVLLNLEGARIVSVSRGNATPVVTGPLQVLRARSSSDGAASPHHHVSEELVFLVCSTFSYPLVDQVLMKSAERTYILPAGNDGAVNYVLSFNAGADTAVLDALLSRFASLRLRDGTILQAPAHAQVVEELLDDGAGGAGAAAAGHGRPPSAGGAAGAAGAGGAAAGGSAGDAGATVINAAVGAAVAVGSAAVAAAPHVMAAASTAANVVYNNLPQSVKDVKAADVGSAASRGLLYAGSLTKTALIAGATVAGAGLKVASDKLADTLGHAEQPTRINPETTARVQQARMVSKAAVTVSSSLVLGAATVAKTLGAAAGSAFISTEAGRKVVEASDTEAGKAVRQVVASGIVAAGEVWSGLEAAAAVVSSDAGTATTGFVTKRYGQEAGVLAAQSVGAVQDAGTAALQVGSLGVKTLLGRTAVEAAGHVVSRTGQATGAGAGGMPALTNGPAGPGYEGAMVVQGHGAGAYPSLPAAAHPDPSSGILGMPPGPAGDPALLAAALGRPVPAGALPPPQQGMPAALGAMGMGGGAAMLPMMMMAGAAAGGGGAGGAAAGGGAGMLNAAALMAMAGAAQPGPAAPGQGQRR